jgi:hypothetical protein
MTECNYFEEKTVVLDVNDRQPFITLDAQGVPERRPGSGLSVSDGQITLRLCSATDNAVARVFASVADQFCKTESCEQCPLKLSGDQTRAAAVAAASA